jgi:hypothetical protein
MHQAGTLGGGAVINDHALPMIAQSAAKRLAFTKPPSVS